MSRDALNIMGLGENQIIDLIDEGILTTFSDLFTNIVPNKDKIVVAPEPWFGDRNFHDIYTEEMIRISPRGEVKKHG